jgi:ribosomal protein S18 acetylase RimI-like enzyme
MPFYDELSDERSSSDHMELEIRRLIEDDIPVIAEAFARQGWNKPASQYRRYLTEQEAGKREVLVACEEGTFRGYLTIVWKPTYQPFREAGIPEIQDFNVLMAYQRRGIGSRLMNAAEARIAERCPVVGIGVGLTADYGPAQILYVRRGYIPDGRGICYDEKLPRYGEPVAVDDGLVLHLTKRLRPSD